VTTTSHATYTEERDLVTKRQVVTSFMLVILGGVFGYLTYFPLYLTLIPLAILLFVFRDWKMLRNYGRLVNEGIIKFEPKFRSNRTEAFYSLLLVLALISIPMIISPFLAPLPWLGLSLGIIMGWPASNLVESLASNIITYRTGKRLIKFYTWYHFREDVAMKDYGWLLK